MRVQAAAESEAQCLAAKGYIMIFILEETLIFLQCWHFRFEFWARGNYMSVSFAKRSLLELTATM